MRIYDKLRRDNRFSEFLQKTKGLPLFIGDDISNWYQKVSDEDWDVDDFPILAPIYNHCFFDYQLPLHFQDKHPDKITLPESFGVYCTWRSPEQVDDEELARPENIRAFHNAVSKYHPKWVLELTVFWELQGKPFGPLWTWMHFLNSDGSVLKSKDTKEPVNFYGPLSDSVIQYVVNEVLNGKEKEEVIDGLLATFAPFLQLTAFSICFFHAKNTKIEEQQTNPYIPHTKAQKRRGDKPLPALTYKTLVVTSIKKALAQSKQENGVKGTKALHFVRGHFHTYTEEAPLFGRDGQIGPYYIPFHPRGNRDVGIVVKDYEMRLKNES